MYIEKAHEVTEELYAAIERLVLQLGAHKISPSREELHELIRSSGTTLLVAREPDEDGPVAGVLCLTVYRVPTGLRSFIDDVVVDESLRRRGIGEGLVRRAMELARAAGAHGISLTSNPAREAANQMYQSLGFEIRQTNTYFYPLK